MRLFPHWKQKYHAVMRENELLRGRMDELQKERNTLKTYYDRVVEEGNKLKAANDGLLDRIKELEDVLSNHGYIFPSSDPNRKRSHRKMDKPS